VRAATDNARLMESYSQGPLTSRPGRAYGEFCSSPSFRKMIRLSETCLTDLEMSYRFSQVHFAIGAENLFDAFPQEEQGSYTRRTIMVWRRGFPVSDKTRRSA